jgi:hypothetical protein
MLESGFVWDFCYHLQPFSNQTPALSKWTNQNVHAKLLLIVKLNDDGNRTKPILTTFALQHSVARPPLP